MTTFQRLERFATRLQQDGKQAYASSGTPARFTARTGAILTGPIGAVTGAAVGGFDRVVSSVDIKSTSELIIHPRKAGEPRRITIVNHGSSLLKTVRFLALPAAVAVAGAGVYNAYALASTGGGLWSMSGAFWVGLIAAGVAWVAKTVVGGVWAGGKLGFKAGVGAASIGAHAVETFLQAGVPHTPPAG